MSLSTAETMYRQALEIKENAYGAEHPSVAKAIMSLLFYQIILIVESHDLFC